MEITKNKDLLLQSTELDGDLLYLQERYDIGSAMAEALVESPTSALFHFRKYKIKMRTICLLFAAMGGAFILISLFRHDLWVGLVSGILGSAIIVYALCVCKKMNGAISEVEKIAKYHGLI